MIRHHTQLRSPATGLPRRRLVATGAAAATIALGGVAPRARAADAMIRIGVSAPLTAQFAQDGEWMRSGITLAAKAINAKGGIKGHPVQLFFEDDQGPNPTAAANAVTKLLTEDQVVALIGPHFTPGMLPVEPMLAQRHVPALTGASGPVVTQQHNDYVFRIRLDDATGAELLVKYVTEKLGWKRIGLDYVNTAFGQSGIAAVKAALTKRGIEPAATQTHLDSTKDFTAQLLTFQQAKVDGIIVWTDDQPSGLLVKQRRTLGMQFGLAGSTSFSQPPFLALAGSAAEGVYAITDFVQQNPDPAITAWKKLYGAAYHAEPELYASTYFDAMNLLADAIAAAGDMTGPSIRDALTKLQGVRGVMTTYSWSLGGDMVHSGLITVVKGGKPEIVEVVTA
jgi:branched-chain amino acid transport system substrate-binding protein